MRKLLLECYYENTVIIIPLQQFYYKNFIKTKLLSENCYKNNVIRLLL